MSEVHGRLDRMENDLMDRLSTLEALLTHQVSVLQRPNGNDAPLTVSVIMPTRNRSRFLQEAVRSVQAQTCPDWTLTIVDDGSTDDTAEIAGRMTADPRIHYIRIDAGNVAVARNAGIAASSGDLIAYLDDDNLWFPDFLAVATQAFVQNPDSVFAYGALVSASSSSSVSPIMWKSFDRGELLRENYVDTNVILHRRRAIEKFGVWDEQLQCLEDWDFALRYTANQEPLQLPVLAALYRSHAPSRMTLNADKEEAYEKILKKWPLN